MYGTYSKIQVEMSGGTECIVVLGGGPADDHGRIPSWTERRCSLALSLFAEKRVAGSEVAITHQPIG